MIYIEQAFCWRLALFIFGRVVPRPYDYYLCAYSLGVFTSQYPPLAGPTRWMMPADLRLARCFSTALAVMPNSPANAAALNLLFCWSSATILSLVLMGFLLLSSVSPMDAW